MINKFGGPQKYGGKLENARHEIAKKNGNNTMFN